MKLYPKKLRSIDDLQKERKILLKRQQQLDEENVFSLNGLLGKSKEGEKNEDSGSSNSIFDFLSVSNPLVDTVLKIVKQRFFKSEPAKKTQYKSDDDDDDEDEKPKNSLPYR